MGKENKPEVNGVSPNVALYFESKEQTMFRIEMSFENFLFLKLTPITRAEDPLYYYFRVDPVKKNLLSDQEVVTHFV